MGLRLPPIVIFDDGEGSFGPLLDLRASFDVRTGAFTALERAPAGTTIWVAPERAPFFASRRDRPVNQMPSGADEVLLLNGRIADPILPELGEIAGGTCALLEARSGHLVAARFPRAAAQRWLNARTLDDDVRRIHAEGALLWSRPWEILDPIAFAQRIASDLSGHVGALPSLAKRPGVTVIEGHPAVARPDARVSAGVVVDAEAGPVMIDAGATVRPGAVLIGPCFIGAHSTVMERTVIKARTVIGPHCKVAGEIGNTIFQGFANKAHDGHLGDSFVGEWANLGAGTTNSNLLNTYGEVSLRLEPDAAIERTGRQFVGALIGDHVKTAILTRLPTGCVIGTGSMIATTRFAPALVPRFSWLTDEGSRPYRFEKFIEVARAVWKRRGLEPDDAMIDALRTLHGRTAAHHAAPARAER